MEFRNDPPRSATRSLIDIFSLAALYAVTGRLGQLAAIPPGHVTAIWPASGIALAAVLLRGKWIWPGIWLGSAIVNVWASREITGGPLPLAVAAAVAAIATGAVLEAIVAAFLIERARGAEDPLDTVPGVLRFVALGALASAVLNATVGTSALAACGLNRWSDFPKTWWTWWLGDSSGILVITPLLLTWRRPRGVGVGAWRRAEVAAFGALLLLVGWISFWGKYSVASFVLPMLVWAALRFGRHGATAAIFAFSAIAIAGAVRGVGPFTERIFTLNESLLLLQGFMATLVLTTLILTAAVEERARATAILREYRDSLEQQVQERTGRLRKTNQELDDANRMLRELSSLDALTEVANRRRFDEAFGAEWRRCQRAGTPLALVLADIDHFKPFNDLHGHQKGDECLKGVARGLSGALGRAGELVARYGGDEFILLLPGSDGEDAAALARKLRAGIEAAGVVTISLGVSSARLEVEDSAEQLLARADRALYQAKERGRNQVVEG